MKIVYWYVVTGDQPEHLNMAVVSAGVLRHVLPEVIVSLACDAECAQAIAASDVDFSRYFDEIRQFDTGHSTSFLRSRAIKIRLRLELRGDFIYLDSDTLVVRPFNDLLPRDCHVAMALDAAEGIPGEGADSRLFEQVGWQHVTGHYFNCGVMFWRDDKRAHQLSQKWLQNWEYSCRQGVVLDQPAMAQSNRELGDIVTVLPWEMNMCPFKSDPGAVSGARVWHFWGHSLYSGTIFHLLMDEFESRGVVNLKRYELARNKCRPWVREGNMGFKHLARQGCWGLALQEVPKTLKRLFGRVVATKDGS